MTSIAHSPLFSHAYSHIYKHFSAIAGVCQAFLTTSTTTAAWLPSVIPPGKPRAEHPHAKNTPDANVTPSCHFQHPVPKAHTGVRGGSRADVFVILLITCVNGKGGLSVSIRPGEWSRAADTS